MELNEKRNIMTELAQEIEGMKADFSEELNVFKEENEQLNSIVEEMQELVKTKEIMMEDKNNEINNLKQVITDNDKEVHYYYYGNRCTGSILRWRSMI